MKIFVIRIESAEDVVVNAGVRLWADNAHYSVQCMP